jgi:periplasmic protein TonB
MLDKDKVQLDKEAFGRPAAGSVLLHGAIVVVMYALVAFHLHGNEWGNNQAPGAIQATLVSSAPALPLPQIAPPTPNVLATETPSPAPVIPEQKVQPIPEPKAIPIPLKQTPKQKQAQKEQTQTPPKHPQPTPPQQNRARYGEAPATAIPHQTQGNPGQSNPVNINGGDFGSRFPWYVAVITRKVNDAWYRQEIDPHTPYGRQVRVVFAVSRAGMPSNVRISQSSGSPTLDSSAERAVQRVETFGPLPSGYNGSNVSVEYTFSFDQPAQ